MRTGAKNTNKVFKKYLCGISFHISLVFSVFMILLVFLDASEPTMQYINSSDTGTIITVYCVIIFVVSVISAARNYGRKRDGVTFVLPHVTIVLSMAMLTFAVTNFFNRSMGFITSDMSKMLLMALSVVGALTSFSRISLMYGEEKNKTDE